MRGAMRATTRRCSLLVSARSAVDLRTSLAGFCDPLVLDLPEQGLPEEAVRLAAVFR